MVGARYRHQNGAYYFVPDSRHFTFLLSTRNARDVLKNAPGLPVLAYSSPCRRRQIIQTPSQPSWSGPPHRIQVFSLISPSLLTNCRSEDRILPSSIPRVLLGSLRSSPGTLGCRPGTRNQCCSWSIHLPVFYHHFNFCDCLEDGVDLLRHYRVSEASQSVHPMGNPISHSTNSGFKYWGWHFPFSPRYGLCEPPHSSILPFWFPETEVGV